jgi:beta-lactamase class D
LFGSTGRSQVTTPDSLVVRDDFQRYFEQNRASGSIVVFDGNTRKWFVSDTAGVYRATLPASTFKIINMLIALETKTIADENEVVKWPGSTDTVKYGYRPDIYHDMTVKEAFEVSAGWVFVELSKRIGRENYTRYLTACRYGNVDLSQPDADFWNFGPFAISPVNQIRFLQNLYAGKLPFSKRNMQIVKRVMVSEKGSGYVIRSKTGWTRVDGTNIGWWVGYIESKGVVSFFATRIFQDRQKTDPRFGAIRKEITKAVLKNLGVLESK